MKQLALTLRVGKDLAASYTLRSKASTLADASSAFFAIQSALKPVRTEIRDAPDVYRLVCDFEEWQEENYPLTAPPMLTKIIVQSRLRKIEIPSRHYFDTDRRIYNFTEQVRRALCAEFARPRKMSRFYMVDVFLDYQPSEDD